MRLDQTILERIDTWRGKQDDLPSRAEAVRRLIEVALATMSDTSITMNASEKMIVSLLCELYKGMKIKGEFDPEFIQSAVRGGHYWALKWAYQGLLHGEYDDEQTLSEVVNILDMWNFIESSYARMPKKDKDYIKTNAKSEAVKFVGFDGNNESKHRSIARFLVEKMGRFSEFKDRGDLDSHYPTLGIYRRMLSVFTPIRAKLVGRDLNATEMVEVLNERIHPTMRGTVTQTI